ncbi:hypothetical protein D3C81_1734890 [compost metagenome]
MRDALLGIIDHHCELIGPETIRPFQHKITNLSCQMLRQWAQPAVIEADGFIRLIDVRYT